MSDVNLTPEQTTAITAYVDIEASPPDVPTAHIIFGANQASPRRSSLAVTTAAWLR